MRGYRIHTHAHTQLLMQIDTLIHTQLAINLKKHCLLYAMSAGLSVMEQTNRENATAMDPHLHKTCSLLTAPIHIQMGRLKPCHVVSK